MAQEMTLDNWRALAALCYRVGEHIQRCRWLFLARFGERSKVFKALVRMTDAFERLLAHFDTVFRDRQQISELAYEPIFTIHVESTLMPTVFNHYRRAKLLTEQECSRVFDMCHTIDVLTDPSSHTRLLLSTRDQQRMYSHIEREKRYAARLARKRVFHLILCAQRYDMQCSFYRVQRDVINIIFRLVQCGDDDIQQTTVASLMKKRRGK